jgi:hypothetical protein
LILANLEKPEKAEPDMHSFPEIFKSARKKDPDKESDISILINLGPKDLRHPSYPLCLEQAQRTETVEIV